MENRFGRTCSDSEHLMKLGASVMVTNVCNLACGGCSVLCGTYSKEKLWFITEEQFRIDVTAAGMHNWHITLYGGEPTAHPGLEKLLDICENEYPHLGFQVFTNGFKPFRERKNVGTRLDAKDRMTNRKFISTLVAAKDVLKVRKDDFYWDLARNRCALFNGCNFQISNGRAYICQTAAAMENLSGTDHGWKVEPGKDPFVRTDEEIREQGRQFCKRCTFCLGDGWLPAQPSKSPHVVSQINFMDVNRKHHPIPWDGKVTPLPPEVRQEASKYILMQ